MFYQIFIHHKYNDGRLLRINMVISNCATSCRITQNKPLAALHHPCPAPASAPTKARAPTQNPANPDQLPQPPTHTHRRPCPIPPKRPSHPPSPIPSQHAGLPVHPTIQTEPIFPTRAHITTDRRLLPTSQ